ncbi:acyl-CoA-binding domain-containing protein 4 isoform X2 [Boleophthalmus pectinirostris]|uniref:acyl-CoA-binding domain-containing protein 4 isoform X2 n=1 Tax=Boleophthalmus pectinirostris TaxID=150288 RepID=UPI000A1C43F5|nr:acyl-CoA-binding domain-containing protein 4 isoform X2 [Boleophthalmus pectinirostris]
MPVPTMSEPALDHERRFQAAVDVIHNLPKNGSYRPSYEVMLRFYSLYKQAVCGPCKVPRPGFWDPVGRYKWDAWNKLGEMKRESAMAAYVDEMKNVAQEVIDTMPMDEKTASLFHHFEPLYHVIHDMPRPPESLLVLREDLMEKKDRTKDESETVPLIDSVCHDSGLSEPLVLTSDSENEIFCDSVDSVEQLNTKVLNGFCESHPQSSVEKRTDGRQAGAGQGGEGAHDKRGPMRSRDSGRDASHWRQRGLAEGGMRRPGVDGNRGAGGAGRGGGGGDGGDQRGSLGVHEAQLQQQIVLALHRLREDMRSVGQRLEMLERLAASNALSSEEPPCWHCPGCTCEEKWWPFDVSFPTLLVFLVWPFVAQGLLSLLRKGNHRRGISS